MVSSPGPISIGRYGGDKGINSNKRYWATTLVTMVNSQIVTFLTLPTLPLISYSPLHSLLHQIWIQWTHSLHLQTYTTIYSLQLNRVKGVVWKLVRDPEFRKCQSGVAQQGQSNIMESQLVSHLREVSCVLLCFGDAMSLEESNSERDCVDSVKSVWGYGGWQLLWPV